MTRLQHRQITITFCRSERVDLLPRDMQLHHFRRRPTKEADGTLSAPDNPLACRICADLISKEGGSIARLADTAFLLGHRERQRLGQECPDFGEHASCILLATDNPNHEVVRVATVTKSAITGVHRVSRRDGPLLRQ